MKTLPIPPANARAQNRRSPGIATTAGQGAAAPPPDSAPAPAQGRTPVLACFTSVCIRSHIKWAIVRLALWGVLPYRWADWLIQRGGLSHE